MQHILNTSRQIQIGKEIHTYDYDRITIKDLSGGLIKYLKLNRQSTGDTKSIRSGKVKYNFDKREYTHSGKDYRASVELFTTGGLVPPYNNYHSVEMKTIHWRKSFGFWFKNDSNWIEGYGIVTRGIYYSGTETCGTNYSTTGYNSQCTYCDEATEDVSGVYVCNQDISGNATIACEDAVYAYLSCSL